MRIINNHWFVLFILLISLITGCKKEPINRKIEGHWILEQFTILQTNETVKCERIYWGITRVATKLFEKQGSHGYTPLEALTEYRDNETILVLKDFKVISNGKDALPEQLHPYGIDNSKETAFQIMESTHKNMILESDYARLEFKKF